MLKRLVAGRIGDVALLDGGMGTFLETQGVAEPWSSGYRIDDPDVNAAVKLGYTTFLKSGVSARWASKAFFLIRGHLALFHSLSLSLSLPLSRSLLLSFFLFFLST